MSKERDLLERFANADWHYGNILDLKEEAKQLLSTPPSLPLPSNTYLADFIHEFEHLLNITRSQHNDKEITSALTNLAKVKDYMYPLAKEHIDALIPQYIYSGIFGIRSFARKIEELHGIGISDD